MDEAVTKPDALLDRIAELRDKRAALAKELMDRYEPNVYSQSRMRLDRELDFMAQMSSEIGKLWQARDVQKALPPEARHS